MHFTAKYPPFRAILFSALALVATNVVFAEEQTTPPLPETETALAALESPPPLPEGIKETGDLVFQAAMGNLTLLSLDDPIPVPETVEEIKDIEYGNADGKPLLLDLYLPKERKEPAPGLIFIHGGSWSGGKRSDYKYYAVRFPQLGYVVATISYRLVPEAIFPACVEDAKCAVRWMRANAEKYGVTPDAIAAIGGSAGGHLAMMLGYSANIPELEGRGGHNEHSSEVQAVVNLYGPVDITLPEHHDNPALLAFFGGKRFEEVPDQYRMASPYTHLTEKTPPTLIIHGTDDDIVPVNQADLLAARLDELGVEYEYLRLTGYPHALDILKEINAYCRWHIYRFLDKHLRNDRKH
ncbi:MAG TPA: alpha/beta hydrolase [Candidatus Hydrogenedentes bacterium]|nr:alpha/beta hydrolase [Candidatus Hydrogenedentota bacterium]